MIDVFAERSIEIAIIHLPISDCALSERYINFEDYNQRHLMPLATYLDAQGIPFYDLDTRFFENIPLEEQSTYFDDAVHSNIEGARLFMEWVSLDIQNWLESDTK
ncbi:MAG: hypothetical protein ACFE0Q_02495 [Anaerolineae bacterium]